MLAIVPDPLHAHLSLEFDRTIDVLLQAASDNGYVESYYWLPWKKAGENGETNAVPWESETRAERHERERQPGLIVLRHVPQEKENVDSGFTNVIYLFLIGSTPVQGVDGYQLENALRYECELQARSDTFPNAQCRSQSLVQTGPGKRLPSLESDHFTFNLSLGDPYTLGIVGSNSTGTTASLRAGIKEHIKDFPRLDRVSIAGVTATNLAVCELSSVGGTSVPMNYLSFAANSDFTEHRLEQLITYSGHDTSRLALLVEDDTVYGAKQNPAPKAVDVQTPDSEVGEDDGPCQNAIKRSERISPATVVRFPRGISLLRNAHQDDNSTTGVPAVPSTSPYLRMSLQDASVEDTVMHFSLTHTPLSEESELMAIARQLTRVRIQFVGIYASDTLDEMFLEEFIHRALPDVRIVSIGGGDLMFERDADNAPFVGALTISPYNLLSPVASLFGHGEALRPFASATDQGTYNAASYTFWDGKKEPRLANYRSLFNTRSESANSREVLSPSLWITANGRNGYYPIGIASNCASYSSSILPSFQFHMGSYLTNKTSFACTQNDSYYTEYRFYEITSILFPRLAERVWPHTPRSVHFTVNPSLEWFDICVLLDVLCIAHLIFLYSANLWSPLTRDLVINTNDEPRRRSLYIHIGSVMIFCMTWIAAYPIFPALQLITPTQVSVWVGLVTMILGLMALLLSLIKTRYYIYRSVSRSVDDLVRAFCVWRGERRKEEEPQAAISPISHWPTNRHALALFHFLAFLANILIPATWIYICEQNHTGTGGADHSYVGLFFSYRCLSPMSGVAPNVPVLLLLFGWFVWAVMQTRRLRFSNTSRPRLPLRVKNEWLYQLFVSDEALSISLRQHHSGLIENIVSLLITREIVSRFSGRRVKGWKINAALSAAFLGLFFLCFICVRPESLERIFYANRHLPTWYEGLVKVLFFPLIMVALTGWLRMILIWRSLRQGLLVQLEQMPIRSAFNRTKREGWMSMMRQSGLEERWREMSRSMESMRQMAHDQDIIHRSPPTSNVGSASLADDFMDLRLHVEDLIKKMEGIPERGDSHDSHNNEIEKFRSAEDLPDRSHEKELLLMYLIETEYAKFSNRLLEDVLVPYWEQTRRGMVETEEAITLPVHARRASDEPDETGQMELHAGPAGEDPQFVRVAEEFVAIRYISLIRAVLVNLRQIMIFVIGAFVLSIVAWNSYPFRPRAWIDASFTLLLFILFSGIVWVFAEMHRDPVLNRITKTQANELGVDFYLRIATFGAAPLLAWLAYQFPSIGNAIVTFIQPGLDVVK